MPVLVIRFSSEKTGNFLVAYKILFADAEEIKMPSEQKETLLMSTASSCFIQGTA